jgi:ribonuclease HI
VQPPATWLKINSDGAFLAKEGRGAWGYVIRGEEGDVIAAGAGYLEHVRDALYAEAYASFQVIRATAEIGMTKVILETDSMIL